MSFSERDPAGLGYEAFLAGVPYSSSPYGDDDENNAHWRFGWRHACSREHLPLPIPVQPNRDREGPPNDEMDSLWCTLNGTGAAEEIIRLRIDLMNVRERLRLAEEDIGRKREALEAVQSDILLTGHLAEIVDEALP